MKMMKFFNSESLNLKSFGNKTFIFFSLYFLYLWLIVQPNLIYQGGGWITNFPVFYTDWNYFIQTVDNPGGLVIYCSAFLSQLLYVSWLGAIVLTVHAFLFYQFTSYFLKKMHVGWYDIIGFIPAVLLLITYDFYTYYFTITFALLVSLIVSCLYISLELKNKVFSIFLFLSLTLILYLIAAGASLYFVLLCALYDVFVRRRFLAAIFEALVALLIVYITGVVFLKISPLNTFSELSPFSWKILVYSERREKIGLVFALVFMLPMLAALFGLWLLFISKPVAAFFENIKHKSLSADTSKTNKAAISEISHIKKFTVSLKSANWINFLKWGLIFGGSAVSILFFHEPRQKAFFEINYYTENRDWAKVLQVAGPFQQNKYILNAVNRALFHLGRLSSDMFLYQQRPDCLILSGDVPYWYKFDLFYDLGSANICESALVEAMDKYGQRPQILKKLALVELAKKDVNTARVYLRALSKTLYYRGWAEDYLKKIDTDPALSTDEDVQRLRSLMPEEDKAFSGYLDVDMLVDLLARNKANNMAFEYLMAQYLLQFDLDKFVQNLPRLDDFNYRQIPRHFEEAVLVYSSFTKKQPDLKGRSISEETQKRFSVFLQTAQSKVTIGQMRQNFGDTYEFYYGAGVSGESKR